jgi:hypothetical protein
LERPRHSALQTRNSVSSEDVNNDHSPPQMLTKSVNYFLVKAGGAGVGFADVVSGYIRIGSLDSAPSMTLWGKLE